MNPYSHVQGLVTAAALFLILCAPCPARAQSPATSKELCQTRVDAVVFPSQIRTPPDQAIRAITDVDRATLKRVLRSQCLLTANDMATYWDNQT